MLLDEQEEVSLSLPRRSMIAATVNTRFPALGHARDVISGSA